MSARGGNAARVALLRHLEAAAAIVRRCEDEIRGELDEITRALDDAAGGVGADGERILSEADTTLLDPGFMESYADILDEFVARVRNEVELADLEADLEAGAPGVEGVDAD